MFSRTPNLGGVLGLLFRDFRLHVDPMYGNCYVFNYDARFNKTNRAGPVFGKQRSIRTLVHSNPDIFLGLRLMLYLDVNEYMPLTQELGARIAVHTAEAFPFPDVFGFNAPAGVTSSFGIRLVRPECCNCYSKYLAILTLGVSEKGQAIGAALWQLHGGCQSGGLHLRELHLLGRGNLRSVHTRSPSQYFVSRVVIAHVASELY